MVHEDNPVIREIKKIVYAIKELDTIPNCPVDGKQCSHYDGPICNNFNCELVKDGVPTSR